MENKLFQAIQDLKNLAAEYRRLAKNISRRKNKHERFMLVDLLTSQDNFLKRGDLLCENVKGKGSCYCCFWDNINERCHGQATYKLLSTACGIQESVRALRRRATFLLKVAKKIEENLK